LIVVQGFFCSLLVARNLSGVVAAAAFLLWLPVSVVILPIALARASEPMVSARPVDCDDLFALLLVPIGIGLAWGLTNLAGAITGRRRSEMPAAWVTMPVQASHSQMALPTGAGRQPIALARENQRRDARYRQTGRVRGTMVADRRIDRDKFDHS
jgi:hypothetical protein